MRRYSYIHDYTTHAMRFYLACIRAEDKVDFGTNADYANFESCRKTLSEFKEEEALILMELYTGRDDFKNNVMNVCRKYDLPPNNVWSLNSAFIVAFGKNRGLI